MSLIARAPKVNTIEPLAEGVYVGTCYLLADLGMHYNEQKDEWKQKIVIGWEINGETITIDGVEQPRTISKFYTNTLHEKANLRKDLECWRGKKFTDEELEEFDLSKIIGTACQLQLVHYTKDDGNGNSKTTVNVKAIMALPKGMQYEQPKQRIIFDLDTDIDKLNSMPKFVQKMVLKSKDFQNSGKPFEEQNELAGVLGDFPEEF